MIRTLLRNWLGITKLEARTVLLQNSIDGLVTINQQVLAKQSELNAMLQQVRELREILSDPKRQPIKVRTSQQFRALMEVEP